KPAGRLHRCDPDCRGQAHRAAAERHDTQRSAMKVNFKVNGQAKSVDVPGDMPLLWTLRDTLDLKGTKFGCGVAQCGACTVHLNGTPTRSCQVPTSSVQ